MNFVRDVSTSGNETDHFIKTTFIEVNGSPKANSELA